MTRREHEHDPLRTPEAESLNDEAARVLSGARDAAADGHDVRLSAGTQHTAVLVARRRSLSLGGLVVIALALGALAGIVGALVKGVASLGTLVIAGLYGLMFVGGALALVIVVIDWALERRRGS